MIILEILEYLAHKMNFLIIRQLLGLELWGLESWIKNKNANSMLLHIAGARFGFLFIFIVHCKHCFETIMFNFFLFWNFRVLRTTSRQSIISGRTCSSSSTWQRHDQTTSPPWNSTSTICWIEIFTISSL